MSQLFSFLLENTAVSRVLTFIVVVLSILAIARGLLYRLIYAWAPESKSLRFAMKPRLVRVTIALADIGAWGLAMMISCLLHKIPGVTQLLLSLFGLFWNLLTLTIVVLLVAYCFSRTGNELILSALGGYYLHYRHKILERYRYFDLGDGEEGEIEAIHFLDTTFRLKKGGSILVRPNAFLMHEVFGFARAIGIEGILDWWQIQQQRGRTERESQPEQIIQQPHRADSGE